MSKNKQDLDQFGLPKQGLQDEWSQLHKLTKVLGRGGQGVVFRTTDPDLVVKFILKDNQVVTNTAEKETYKKKLSKLSLYPISPEFNIAKPLFILKDQAGYVMQMMQGMQSVQTMLDYKKPKDIQDDLPSWLDSELPIETSYPLAHYAKTGGSKQRLAILMQTATELSKLHSVGLIYGDISPENVFCSVDRDFNHVWFIDADNIRFDTPKRGSIVYTPGYGAPEVVTKQDGCRPQTDCYSFATLAFKLLAIVAPFDGAALDEDGGWDEGEVSTEDKAQQGLLPFIDDLIDDSNRAKSGLPRELVLTPELKTLFAKTFTEGRINPWQRPTIHHWPEALAAAHDSMIPCLGCNMSYYPTDHKECPYCKLSVPNYFQLNCYQWQPNEVLQKNIWQSVYVAKDAPITVPERVLQAFTVDSHDQAVLELYQLEGYWFIRQLSDHHTITITDSEGVFKPLVGQWHIELDSLKQQEILLYVQSELPRVIELKWQGK